MEIEPRVCLEMGLRGFGLNDLLGACRTWQVNSPFTPPRGLKAIEHNESADTYHSHKRKYDKPESKWLSFTSSNLAVDVDKVTPEASPEIAKTEKCPRAKACSN